MQVVAAAVSAEWEPQVQVVQVVVVLVTLLQHLLTQPQVELI
jgi:hypothetical protein